jgi:ABC-type sugar transport system ATPase subunit
MVFQAYVLYPHMTCYENLALNLRLKGIPRSEVHKREEQTAQLLEIGDLLAKKPRSRAQRRSAPARRSGARQRWQASQRRAKR